MTESMVLSFWGPVTSTTELCEQNYAYSTYIAEFYNTISNIPGILLALIGLVNALRQRFEKRFSILHVSNMILAIGNIAFHATLQLVYLFCTQLSIQTGFLVCISSIFVCCAVALLTCSARRVFKWGDQVLCWWNFRVQQSDETPMMWEKLLYFYVLYSPDWHYRSTMPTFLFLYAAGFAITHYLLRLDIFFKAQYILLCLLCFPRMYKYYIQTKDARAKRIAKLYVATLFLGGLCWLVDRIFCKKLSTWFINPQGHAWWHVLMGFNSYFANTFLMFCRAQQLEWNPQVFYLFGLFPYVRIEKTKSN